MAVAGMALLTALAHVAVVTLAVMARRAAPHPIRQQGKNYYECAPVQTTLTRMAPLAGFPDNVDMIQFDRQLDSSVRCHK
jgi:ABC-type transport system involved in cytochrome c biogenesis permease subunit